MQMLGKACLKHDIAHTEVTCWSICRHYTETHLYSNALLLHGTVIVQEPFKLRLTLIIYLFLVLGNPLHTEGRGGAVG